MIDPLIVAALGNVIVPVGAIDLVDDRPSMAVRSRYRYTSTQSFPFPSAARFRGAIRSTTMWMPASGGRSEILAIVLDHTP